MRSCRNTFAVDRKLLSVERHRYSNLHKNTHLLDQTIQLWAHRLPEEMTGLYSLLDVVYDHNHPKWATHDIEETTFVIADIFTKENIQTMVENWP